MFVFTSHIIKRSDKGFNWSTEKCHIFAKISNFLRYKPFCNFFVKRVNVIYSLVKNLLKLFQEILLAQFFWKGNIKNESCWQHKTCQFTKGMDPLTQEELIQQAQVYLATCPKWIPDKSKCQGCKASFSGWFYSSNRWSHTYFFRV